MEAAMEINAVLLWAGPGMIISFSLGFPMVTVPVLSKSTQVILLAFSRTSPFLMRRPFDEAMEVKARTASGVASPRLQGHAMTSTEIPAIRERWAGALFREYPATVARAMRRIAGTKYPTILSARIWI